MSHIIQSGELLSELTFAFSRSSGPGGQNVNKVNSKVTLLWDLAHSSILDEARKTLLLHRLASRITNEGVLVIVSQDSRSQLQNKEIALQKLDQILKQALTPRKPRKATKPSKAAKHKRLKTKKLHSEKKSWRRKL